MAETIPSLLKKLKDAESTIRQLKDAKQDAVVIKERVEVPLEKIRIVKERIPGPVQEKVVYYTDPAQEDMIRKLQDRIRELEGGD